MILSLTGAEILYNDVLLGFQLLVSWINFRIFEVMSAYNIGYQLIMPYPKERTREFTSSISIPLDSINVEPS
jgi:hypothetical protein